MEHEFTKQEILELYLNVIFFGQRAYGVAAAAETFFGKPLDELDGRRSGHARRTAAGALALQPDHQSAARHGAPRTTCCGACRSSATSMRPPPQARQHGADRGARARAAATTSRRRTSPRWRAWRCVSRFGAGAEQRRLQGLHHDRRPPADGRQPRACGSGSSSTTAATAGAGPPAMSSCRRTASPTSSTTLVDEFAPVGNLAPAVVVSVARQDARACTSSAARFAQIDWDGMSWARKAVRNETWVRRRRPPRRSLHARRCRLRRRPMARARAARRRSPRRRARWSRSIRTMARSSALVGGFDYFTNKYNRVTQARRQPGSGFKPFLYSAALENGFTPASVILRRADRGRRQRHRDRPGARRTSSGNFSGPTRLREALVHSRNLVSIRLLREIGIGVRDRLRHALRLRHRDLPQQPDAGARHAAGHAARCGHRLCDVRQRRLTGSAPTSSSASRTPRGRSPCGAPRPRKVRAAAAVRAPSAAADAHRCALRRCRRRSLRSSG